MKINIHPLIQGKQTELDFKGNHQVDLSGFGSDTSQDHCDLQVSGQVAKSGNKFIVKGILEGDLPMICGSCMDRYTQPFRADVYGVFSSDPLISDEDEEIGPINQSSIDLSDIIHEALYLNFPMIIRCKEDCLGMCTVCGANKNHKQCNCEERDIDPRLEQLKNIFSPTYKNE